MDVARLLDALALPRHAALSVIVLELLPELATPADPLGADLGRVRIIRTSPLIPVAPTCG
jgi:hypothetical protein